MESTLHELWADYQEKLRAYTAFHLYAGNDPKRASESADEF